MQAHRPNRLIAVLGTHTEVGKTWVSTRLLLSLKERGMRVAARKPAQSFDPNTDLMTDAAQLARATGEDIHAVCPAQRIYPVALAPPMAANLLSKPQILLQDLLAEIRWTADIDAGLVETVGGPRSPISHDGDSIDLALQLRPDMLLLVADAGLGTLNAVRLSLACMKPIKTVVFLNRYDQANELHQLNRRWLVEHDGLQVATHIEELAAMLWPPSPAKRGDD